MLKGTVTKKKTPLYRRSHKSFKDTTLNTPGEVEATAQPADMKSRLQMRRLRQISDKDVLCSAIK